MDTPEQAARARESRAKGEAEWAAKVREEQDHRMRIRDAAQNPHPVEQQAAEARRELAMARMRAGRIDPGDLDARLTAAEAIAKAARTALDIIQVRAQAAQVNALGAAGADPVARAKAVARAQSDWAETVGTAEADFEAASLDLDRTAVEAARVGMIAAHRIKAAEARLAERAKADADPLRLSNPFADPIRPVITQSQFDSIRDPGLRAKAAKEADIVPDADPTFAAADAKAVLAARGSEGRTVLARSEFDALSPADKRAAAAAAIIIDG